jgi:hypothetical protein
MTQSEFSPRYEGSYYYERRRPWESNSERLVTDALQESQLPEATVRGIKPPLPQIVQFPSRYGYPTYQDRQAGIEAVLDFNRLYPDHRNNTSGGIAEIDGSARNINMGSFG